MERTHPSIQTLPDTPGVYLFLGRRNTVLYVGKATSLKDRVRSYFSSDLAKTRGVHMVKMVEEARKVDVRRTGSVLEALILEAKLIKELKPPFNTRDKDDKSYNYLVITMHEDFPRLLTVRGKDLTALYGALCAQRGAQKKKPLVYGPFPHATQFKEALRIIRKIFPYYDTRDVVTNLREKRDKKLLFNESIGVYPEAGTTKREYARTIRHIKMLFDGKLTKLLTTLERDMYAYAKKERFEDASRAKRELYALQHIEDVSLIRSEDARRVLESFRVEGYDVAHLGGDDSVGVMVVVDEGVLDTKEYRTFSIRHAVKGSDTGALREVLERRLAHPEWQYPRLIVVDGGVAQVNVAKKVLADAGVVIPVVAVTKDDRHRQSKVLGPMQLTSAYGREILLVNAEAHRFSLAVHKKKRAKRIRS